MPVFSIIIPCLSVFFFILLIAFLVFLKNNLVSKEKSLADSSSSLATSSPTYLPALIAGIAALLLGPICCAGGLSISGLTDGLTPFFVIGFIYSLVIFVAIGFGISGIKKGRNAAEPGKAVRISIIGLTLALLGLCWLLVNWGSFIFLPCGIYGC